MFTVSFLPGAPGVCFPDLPGRSSIDRSGQRVFKLLWWLENTSVTQGLLFGYWSSKTCLCFNNKLVVFGVFGKNKMQPLRDVGEESLKNKDSPYLCYQFYNLMGERIKHNYYEQLK